MLGIGGGSRRGFRRLLREEDGYALALFAGLAVPMLALFCLVFEFGRAWTVQQQIDAAARAAAGVGAAYFYDANRNTMATEDALAVYRLDPDASVSFSPPTPSPETANSPTSNPPTITVTVTSSVPSVFGSLFGSGFSIFTLSSSATAQRIGCAWNSSTNSAPAPQTCSYLLAN